MDFTSIEVRLIADSNACSLLPNKQLHESESYSEDSNIYMIQNLILSDRETIGTGKNIVIIKFRLHRELNATVNDTLKQTGRH